MAIPFTKDPRFSFTPPTQSHFLGKLNFVGQLSVMITIGL